MYTNIWIYVYTKVLLETKARGWGPWNIYLVEGSQKMDLKNVTEVKVIVISFKYIFSANLNLLISLIHRKSTAKWVYCVNVFLHFFSNSVIFYEISMSHLEKAAHIYIYKIKVFRLRERRLSFGAGPGPRLSAQGWHAPCKTNYWVASPKVSTLVYLRNQ